MSGEGGPGGLAGIASFLMAAVHIFTSTLKDYSNSHNDKNRYMRYETKYVIIQKCSYGSLLQGFK
jgi:hypothetical protein